MVRFCESTNQSKQRWHGPRQSSVQKQVRSEWARLCRRYSSTRRRPKPPRAKDKTGQDWPVAILTDIVVPAVGIAAPAASRLPDSDSPSRPKTTRPLRTTFRRRDQMPHRIHDAPPVVFAVALLLLALGNYDCPRRALVISIGFFSTPLGGLSCGPFVRSFASPPLVSTPPRLHLHASTIPSNE